MSCVEVDSRPDAIHNTPSHSELPTLPDGFAIPLEGRAWAALFPRHHVMWVSPVFSRVREFVRLAKTGTGAYGALLSDSMKASFARHYASTRGGAMTGSHFPKGELLDSAVSFLTTNDCNLACQYCFSGAEPKKLGVIPWEVAKSAIDLGARNAVLSRLRNGSGNLHVSFFGGGEPTEYWDRFAGIVEYARTTARNSGISVSVATITNGQIAPERWEWVRQNIDEITISMDGFREIQDAQRPTAQGGSSFDASWKFLSAMAASAKAIKAIRVTVTAQTVTRLIEIATFFWDNLPMAYPLQFEPVYFSEVGRQNSDMPAALDFVSQFRAVEEFSRRRQIDNRPSAPVGTATRPVTLRNGAYCDSLEGKGIFITPNGYLSLCSEVSVPTDPRKDDYFVGGYDSASKRFRIFDDGAAKVRSGPSWWCRGCFAQFSCRGGCEPRSKNADRNVRKWWCQMVRHGLRGVWSDVRAGKIEPTARIGDQRGEELIWLPIWSSSTSMD